MSSRVGYGQRRVRVTAEVIEAWLVNESKVRAGLPEDARFLRMYPEERGRWYYLVFESGEWDELVEGEEIPDLGVEVQESPITLRVRK